jgi:hypothetical protein
MIGTIAIAVFDNIVLDGDHGTLNFSEAVESAGILWRMPADQRVSG